MDIIEGAALAKAIWDDDPEQIRKAWASSPSWTAPLPKQAIALSGAPRGMHELEELPTLWALRHRKQAALEALLDLRAAEMKRLGVASLDGELARDEMALAAREGFLGACEKIASHGWVRPKPWLAGVILRDLARSRGKKTPEGITWAQALEPVVEWIVSFGGDLDRSMGELFDEARSTHERVMISHRDKDSTLMEWAGSARVARALVAAGANPDGPPARRARGRSPLTSAMESGRRDWIEELARAGASLEPMFSGPRANEWSRKLGEDFARRARGWALEGARQALSQACEPSEVAAAKNQRPRL